MQGLERREIPLDSKDDFRITWHKLNQASYSRQDAEIYIPEGDWVMTDQITIPNGIRSIRGAGAGPGGTRIFMDGGADKKVTSLILRNLEGIEISNIQFIQSNRSDYQEGVIYAINSRNIIVRECEFQLQDKGAAIFISAFAKQGNCGCVLIEDVDIYASRLQPEHTGGNQATGQEVIRLAAAGDTNSATSLWKTRKVSRSYTDFVCDVVINRVRIDGGYYGVGASGVRNLVVKNSSFTHVTRGISLQDDCTACHVHDNIILNQHSSGIHLAFGTNSCIVEKNLIQSNRAEGEGFIQAYTGATDNRFLSNTLVSDDNSSFHPKWFIYAATHAHRNSFIGNTIKGYASRAAVAFENDWLGSTSQTASRAFNTAGWDLTNYASESLKRIFFKDNTIPPQPDGVPEIFISKTAAIKDTPSVFGDPMPNPTLL